MVEELEPGIHRVTFDLPLGIDHVHCYFLRTSNGGWILVDTGLGSSDPEARWGPVLAELDAPVERIVVTHMHPDHVGGATDVAGLTGAPVLQGREDHEQCVRAWGARDPELFASYWSDHGMPARPQYSSVRRGSNIRRKLTLPVEPPVPMTTALRARMSRRLPLLLTAMPRTRPALACSR